MTKEISRYLKQLKLPDPASHKGQNGKLLIIGGSQLFHAASKWSLDIASKLVDMVFYSSIPSNNQLVKEAKGQFWNGIVVERQDLDNYFAEADCILIGPGMTRSSETEQLVNQLLTKYPRQKWVVDAGALQMVEPKLLGGHCLITPHQQELKMVGQKLGASLSQSATIQALTAQGAVVLLKGRTDTIFFDQEQVVVSGGNAGMTKGGTGDVLAGLAAALACSNDLVTSAVVASHINKQAGDSLYSRVGPFFNSSDLVAEVPKILWHDVESLQNLQ